jgi:hypothetical protein
VLDEVNVCGAWAALPTYGVTVNEVMGLPPSFGCDHETVTSPFPEVTATPVGVAGTFAGVDVVVVGPLEPPTSDPVPEAPPPPKRPGPPTVFAVDGPSGRPPFPPCDRSDPVPVGPAPDAGAPATVVGVTCAA